MSAIWLKPAANNAHARPTVAALHVQSRKTLRQNPTAYPSGKRGPVVEVSGRLGRCGAARRGDFCRLPAVDQRRIRMGRRPAADEQLPDQGSRRPAPVLVHDRSQRLLAGNQHHVLDRVAAVENEPGGLPRQQPDLAHCRSAAGLDRSAKIMHSRGIFGGHDLCRASGERGIGGLDRPAEEYDGDVVLFAVDFVVRKMPHAGGKCWHSAWTFPRRTVGTRIARKPRPLVAALHHERTASNHWYWLSLAAFFMAMLCKGSVAVLPVLLLGIVWWMRPLSRRSYTDSPIFPGCRGFLGRERVVSNARDG